MNPELSAYLDRLIIPARKHYAVAYAEHVLSGAAKPSVPKGLDSETAAKIARKVTRYASKPTSTAAIPEGLQHLPDAIKAYASEHGITDLLELVDAFTTEEQAERSVEAALEHAAYIQNEKLADHYTPEREAHFIDSAEVDILDLTDLEAPLARSLALKLARWNGGSGKAYEYRNGRRMLHRTIRRIDVNDPTVQAIPSFQDLSALISERRIERAA